MNSFRRWDDAEEQVEVLTAERDDLVATVAERDARINELEAQLHERCAGCPTPVAKTINGAEHDWRDGAWVKR